MRQVDGYTEILDADGKVVHRQRHRRQKRLRVQDPKSLTQPEPAERPLQITELPDGQKVFAPTGLNIDSLPQERWPFGEAWTAKICSAITEGRSLSAVCKQEGFPPIHTVFKWRRLYPEFAAEVEEALKMRSSWAEEQILHIAETCGEDVKAERLKAELFQWIAEIGDRRTYQRSTRLEQEIPKVNITIVTGVPDPDPVDVPSWDPKDDPEWKAQAEKSPLFCQANTMKEEG